MGAGLCKMWHFTSVFIKILYVFNVRLSMGKNSSIAFCKVPDSHDIFICRYGTKEGVVGDEKGYVVSMSKCEYKDKPYIIKKGEKLTLQALYNVGLEDDRTWLKGPFHDGVMGLWFMTGKHCEKDE